MNSRKKPQHIIVVGAGISGATAANELAKKLPLSPKCITILEMNDKVGGKLKTFIDDKEPKLVAEYGAGVLTHNYPILNVISQKKIKLETLLPTDHSTVQFANEINKRSLWGKFTYLSHFLWQNIKFGANVWKYNRACDEMADQPPEDQEKSLAEYFQTHHLGTIGTFLQFLWTGFGYGSYQDKNNYAYRALNYMGYTTIPSISSSFGLLALDGGYQQLVEKMLEGFQVETSAKIQSIERNEQGVVVDYIKNGQLHRIHGDLLVLATSPYYWPSLNMKLTDCEQACVDHLSYYRYPVAICRIKGMKPEQVFLLDALSEDGFGHPAFVFTKDNRKLSENEGRLCTVYINLPQGDNQFSLDPGSEGRRILVEDIKKIPGVTDVEIADTHIWPDYNPSVPWKIGMDLQKEELTHHSNTLHAARTYLPHGFDSVGCASASAIKAVDSWLEIKESLYKKTLSNLQYAYHFFTLPKSKPIASEDLSTENGIHFKNN